MMSVVMSSCYHREPDFVNFNNVGLADSSWFKPTRTANLSLDNGIPDNCYLPGGIQANTYEPEVDITSEGGSELRTSSTSMTNVMQQLLDYTKHNNVVEIAGVYKSIDQNGDSLWLSGKVLVPASGKFKRFILVSHYTIGSDAEAPSNCFPLEGVLCQLGYAMIFPDYIGYGVTSTRIHPYLAMDLTASNVLDMYRAVKPFLHAAGCDPEMEDIYLMGYSQGGATTMAVQRLIENHHPEIRIRRVFAGGGPYDVYATYENFIETSVASYPCAVPMVVQGMNEGARLGIEINSLFTPRIANHLDIWINSKLYTTAQINTLIGTKDTRQIISEKGHDRASTEVACLYKALKNNSIVYQFDWDPAASVYILHSMDDETVPYLNAQHAKDAWQWSNITFNFGHYGSHVNTALRFIYTVRTLLQEEER